MIEQVYQFVIALIPDYVMIGMMGLAAYMCYRRYRIRQNPAVFALIIPLVGFMLFYIWGFVFQPPALSRLAAGRGVSFALSLGIIVWAYFTNDNKDGERPI